MELINQIKSNELLISRGEGFTTTLISHFYIKTIIKKFKIR